MNFPKTLLSFLILISANCYALDGDSSRYKISYKKALGLDTTEIGKELKKGLDINAGYKDQVTLLDMAIYGGSYVEVKYLLDHGANIDQQNGYSSTPLMIATEDGLRNDSIAELLINRGANVNIISARNESALINTIGIRSKDPNPKIFKMLIEHGADYNYVCSFCSDRSIFIWCCGFGTTEMLQLLLDKKVNINQVDMDGVSGLMRACLEENEKNVALLLEQPGIDLDHKTLKGITLMDYAEEMRNPKIIALVTEALQKKSQISK